MSRKWEIDVVDVNTKEKFVVFFKVISLLKTAIKKERFSCITKRVTQT